MAAVTILQSRTHLSGCEESRSSPQHRPGRHHASLRRRRHRGQPLLFQLPGLPAAGCPMATRLPLHLLSRLVRCSQGIHPPASPAGRAPASAARGAAAATDPAWLWHGKQLAPQQTRLPCLGSGAHTRLQVLGTLESAASSSSIDICTMQALTWNCLARPESLICHENGSYECLQGVQPLTRLQCRTITPP